MRLNSTFFALCTASCLMAAASLPARADSTGFDSIHAKQRVGGKLCFVDHAHGGSGSGASRQVAERNAARSWYDYTAGEYGSDWANINKAVKKSVSCSPSGGGWSCDINATPCR